MKVGLLGGTFDPIHYGHLLLAEQCREQCELQEVWFLPAGSPPHKQNQTITDYKSRVEMLELATAGVPEFRVNLIESEREGPTYTVTSLEELTTDYPEIEFFFLIGADSLADLPKWREPERILEFATVVAANRGDEPIDLETLLVPEPLASLIRSRVQVVSMPGTKLSSSTIREKTADKKSIRYLTPRAVEVYLRQHQLYQS